MQDVLLSFTFIFKIYNNAELAKLLFEITKIYKCTTQIKFLIFDNASILNTIINFVKFMLTEIGITWPVDFYQL